MGQSIPFLFIFITSCFLASLLISTVNSEEEVASASAASSTLEEAPASSLYSDEAPASGSSSKSKSKRKKTKFNVPLFQSMSSNYSTEAVYKRKHSDDCPEDDTECIELCEEDELEEGWKVEGKCVGRKGDCQCKEFTEENNLGPNGGGPLGKIMMSFLDRF
ncbi:unnamed protein product [Orchesella dallaii]|uniref:Uncharacterized protein n=1 Tax=Orchesella dallaii TaxID=48710 RepID=A0ABP1RYT7_9HEXA